jgi:hypothetical protein
VRNNRRVTSARFDDAEENSEFAGTSPASTMQEESIDSSHEQSSF